MEHPENHKYIIQDINSISDGETMFLRKNMQKKKQKQLAATKTGEMVRKAMISPKGSSSSKSTWVNLKGFRCDIPRRSQNPGGPRILAKRLAQKSPLKKGDFTM